jgi:hypothetical protein
VKEGVRGVGVREIELDILLQTFLVEEGIKVASRSWKRKDRFFPRASRRNSALSMS